jgi:hypothetical protein
MAEEGVTKECAGIAWRRWSEARPTTTTMDLSTARLEGLSQGEYF